jgi:flagellar basal-body rod protein FlgC
MPDFFNSTNVNALDVSGSALAAQRIRMNTIANNLANVNTTRNDKGFREIFRRKEVVFKTGNPAETGNSNYGIKVEEVLPDMSAFRKVYEPDHPDADPNGYVNMPNVRSPLEMIDMIEASRAYEANLTAIQVTKSMNTKSLELLS